MKLATIAASKIDPQDLEGLRWAQDMKTEQYQKVWKDLNNLRRENPEILYAFIQRPTDDEDVWEFVVDADSNYFLPIYYDNNLDGNIDESDEATAPGTKNYWPYASGRLAMQGPYFEISTPNQWCECITGMAPIYDLDGKVIAVLELDSDGY